MVRRCPRSGQKTERNVVSDVLPRALARIAVTTATGGVEDQTVVGWNALQALAPQRSAGT